MLYGAGTLALRRTGGATRIAGRSGGQRDAIVLRRYKGLQGIVVAVGMAAFSECEVALAMSGSRQQKVSKMADGGEPAPQARVFGVLPAAGRSRRMGQPKLLLPAGSGTVIERVLETWRACMPVVVVVVHPQDGALAEVCRRCGAHVVVAQPPPPDMRASVCCALDELRRVYMPHVEDGWLLAPADMAGLSCGAIQGVLAARRQGGPEILVPTWNGRRGHPVYFSWRLAEAVAELPAGVGIDALVRAGPVREVPAADASVLADLDTPEAYEAFLRAISGVNSG